MKHVAWVRDNSLTKGAERIVLVMLASAADEENARSFVSIPTLTRWTGLGRSTVIRALGILAYDGAIQVEKRGGQSSLYTVVMADRSQIGTGPNVRQNPSQIETKPVPIWDP
jgi:hypothetical protein